jgi:hypothetical protein
MKMLVAVLPIAIAVGSYVPQAHADDNSYLGALQGTAVLQEADAQALLREGYKVCTAIHQRRLSDTQAVDMIKIDLSVSDAAAIQIYSAAINELTC